MTASAPIRSTSGPGRSTRSATPTPRRSRSGSAPPSASARAARTTRRPLRSLPAISTAIRSISSPGNFTPSSSPAAPIMRPIPTPFRPGELDTFLILRDAAGNILATNDDNSFPSDISSSIGFFADTSGTYYIDATAYAGPDRRLCARVRHRSISARSTRSTRSTGSTPTTCRSSMSTACPPPTSISAAAGETFGADRRRRRRRR